jgi:hypothetical protein
VSKTKTIISQVIQQRGKSEKIYLYLATFQWLVLI